MGGERPLRIGLLGGVPRSLGGGGLDIQISETRKALRRRGLMVEQVAGREPFAFDLLHAFGNDVGVWQDLSHWRLNRTPLVVSPVLVVQPGREQLLMQILNRVPWRGTEAQMRRSILDSADLLIALNRPEERLLTRLAPGTPRTVIGNGVDPAPGVGPRDESFDLTGDYVVFLGTVSARKRQVESVAAMSGSKYAPVVVGGIDCSVDRDALLGALERAGGRWLGEISSPGTIRAVLSSARALVQMSYAEGQSLAVLEALSVNVPVVASAIPSHRELAETYPNHVILCEGPSGLPRALARLPDVTSAPRVPTWDDVASILENTYRRVLRHGRGR